MLKSILSISVQFPPLGGSIVQRVFYNADMLSKLGHDVFVLTEEPTRAWLQNTSLIPQFLPQSHIIRIQQFPNRQIGRVALALNKVLPFIFYPDIHAAWIFPAFNTGKDIIKKNQIHAVLVNLGSPSALIVAYLLKKKFPYLSMIVDIQDLWAGNPVDFGTQKKWFLYKFADNTLEKHFFSKTDAVATISNSQAEIIRTKYPHLSKSVYVVPHGYDEQKFCKVIPEKSQKDKMIFRYTGYVHPDMQVNIFFEAIKKLKDTDKNQLKDVRIEFYGGNPNYVRSLADKTSVEDIVQAYSHVDHHRVLSLMIGADVLLLFWTSDPGCVCGKLFEYLRSNKLIIAFDQGNVDGRKVIEKNGRGLWVSTKDISRQIKLLSDIIESYRQNQPLLPHDLPDISKYSRLFQVQKLSEIIYGIDKKNQRNSLKENCR